MLKREPYIDMIIGPQSYHEINNKILNYIKKKEKLEITEFSADSKFDYLSKIKNDSSKISSYLTIQEGCDKFCHFCVVPFTRGPEYSRPFKQIMDEAKNLVDNGAKELTLLGQNVNAYNNEGFKLSNLITEIEKFPSVERIRYSTSHPNDMTADLIEVYKSSRKLMPLVHLPVQSGSNKVLKLMNRKHTIREYLEVFDKLEKINSKIKFSSDFIIGYPGENEEDFQDTINLIKRIKFINSYSFIFSPRPGTVASDYNLIDKKISNQRLLKVQNSLFENQINMNKSFESKTIKVLVENLTKDKSQVFGRSEYMTPVIFDGKEDDIGKIMSVKIVNCNRSTLFGKLAPNLNQKVA